MENKKEQSLNNAHFENRNGPSGDPGESSSASIEQKDAENDNDDLDLGDADGSGGELEGDLGDI